MDKNLNISLKGIGLNGLTAEIVFIVLHRVNLSYLRRISQNKEMFSDIQTLLQVNKKKYSLAESSDTTFLIYKPRLCVS